jgi:hypothetical protein
MTLGMTTRGSRDDLPARLQAAIPNTGQIAGAVVIIETGSAGLALLAERRLLRRDEAALAAATLQRFGIATWFHGAHAIGRLIAGSVETLALLAAS